MMDIIEVVFGLLVAVAGLALLARKLPIPYPILLVFGGLLLSLVPGLPQVRLDPKLVFLFFLPPLLYPAALFTPWRDFRANLRPISLLAIGLVLFTTVAVGLLAHYLIPGLPFAAGFVLGAIISPPDAIAATAIAEHLSVPRRIITILEGESLVNDATALVALRFAIVAVVTGSFSLPQASGRFLVVGIGGILVGLVVGFLTVLIQKPIDDPPVEITISLLTPFAAFLPAEQLGVSGVNGFIFLLIGLEVPEALRRLSGRSMAQLLGYAAAISLAVILIRILWVFPASYLPRFLFRRIRERDPYPAWQHVTVVAWTGMRGVVSLAAALALPITFPARDLILFLTFAVILATLVIQGLSLPSIIRWLGIEDDGAAQKEEREARLKANEAALARLNEIGESKRVNADILQRMRVEYEDRIRQLEAFESEDDGMPHGLFSSDYEHLASEALSVERKIILQLRNEGVINDEVLRRIQRDIDLAEARLARPAN
jgi:CPA1 family monovalent cation:H+ antiporter